MIMSSQMQLLTSNPVPLIGTRFSNTTSSVGFVNERLRQCLVNKLDSSPKRCLFGKPAPGEIKRLLDEQTEQNRKHLLNKYNFDIYACNNQNNCNENNVQIITASATTTTTTDNNRVIINSSSNNNNIEDINSISSSISNKINGISDNKLNCNYNQENQDNNVAVEEDADETTETNLIELELRAYRSRLAADESNNQSTNKNRRDVKCNSIKNLSLTDKDTKCNQQRKKPYKRQTSLTEFYRQTSSCVSSIKAIQISEMPKSQRAKFLILQHEEQQVQLLSEQEKQHKSTPDPHFDNA